MTKESYLLLYVTLVIFGGFIWVCTKALKYKKELNKHINNENHLILKIHQLNIELDKYKEHKCIL